MAAMHEAFIRLAKVRSVVTLADLIGDDKAGVALRKEGMGATKIAKAVGCKRGNVYKTLTAAGLNGGNS